MRLIGLVSGYHPWFTHTISLNPNISKEDHYRSLFLDPSSPDPSASALLETLLPSLPTPTPLSSILDTLRNMLASHPNALLGEIGLDRSFRIAHDYHASPRVLTPFTIPMSHQLPILEAQLDIAVELGRCISMHSVKCHAMTMELLSRMNTKWGDKWRAVSVDIHSCSFSAQMWTDMEVRLPSLSKPPRLNATGIENAPKRIPIPLNRNQRPFSLPQTPHRRLLPDSHPRRIGL
jgi:Tat protein secretion system quality control protein TatD with DNase activity